MWRIFLFHKRLRHTFRIYIQRRNHERFRRLVNSIWCYLVWLISLVSWVDHDRLASNQFIYYFFFFSYLLSLASCFYFSQHIFVFFFLLSSSVYFTVYGVNCHCLEWLSHRLRSLSRRPCASFGERSWFSLSFSTDFINEISNKCKINNTTYQSILCNIFLCWTKQWKRQQNRK